ncbi:MAG: hypothetical protein LKI03_06075 [Acetobacter indonesiensis]|jgi:hypothetical protein|nr:hypothetical protein [Acetobacter indonesiensis]MCI1546152.1 hypothetical protein [Acetobacter indonesiensis]MCI1765598.1 hypothetical protein [Acetobacter indonesiensis]
MLSKLLSPDAKLQRDNTKLRAENARFLDAVARLNRENLRLRDELRQARLERDTVSRARDREGRFS